MPEMKKNKKADKAAPTVNHELRKLLSLAKKYNPTAASSSNLAR